MAGQRGDEESAESHTVDRDLEQICGWAAPRAADVGAEARAVVHSFGAGLTVLAISVFLILCRTDHAPRADGLADSRSEFVAVLSRRRGWRGDLVAGALPAGGTVSSAGFRWRRRSGGAASRADRSFDFHDDVCDAGSERQPIVPGGPGGIFGEEMRLRRVHREIHCVMQRTVCLDLQITVRTYRRVVSPSGTADRG